MFVVLLVWLGTRQVIDGELTIGELISFLGYALFMIYPIQTFFEFAQKLTRATVSARRAIAIFEQQPPWIDATDPRALPEHGDLVDEETGFVAHEGQLTIVVSAVPEDTSALADRLGRYLSTDVEPISQDIGEGVKGRAARRARAEREAERARIAARDEERARQRWGVTLGGVDLSEARLTDVRGRILVSDSGSQLFAGTLQDAVDPHGRLDRHQAEDALRVANAEDVYDALPGGWQGQLDERGRGLSGGQRQRVVLARAIAAEAPVLVLVEPTSAVDAHTEARIAERVADVRRGRTTVVTTVSPLWLHHADRIVLVQDNQAIAEGTHEDLLLDSPDYRRVVTRAMDFDGQPVESPADVSRCATSSPDGLGGGRPCLTCWPPPPTPGATGLPMLPSSRQELIPPREGSFTDRVRALRRRHALRERRALENYAQSRKPERGWPVADNRAVLAFFRTLLRERRRVFVVLVVLNGLAAATGLVVPRLLGSLINETVAGDAESSLNSLALLIVGVVCAQALLTFLAQRTSTVFGQDLLSSAREYIVRTILALPLGRVESASSGDLVTRVTRDVGTMSRSVQYGVPMAIISSLTVVLSIIAMLLNSVVLAVPSLMVIGLAFPQVRRYLQKAPKGYINEGATYSRINSTLTETVEGARTVEALGLADRRVQAGDDDIDISAQAERYTMTLRNLLFAVIDVAFNAPRVVTLLVGAYGYAQGWVSLGQITAAVLYVEALSGPLDRLVGEVDRLQVGAASTSRLLGIAEVPADRIAGTELPDGPELVGEDLRFAYREGHDVLHGVDLRLSTGERLAIVGPSGSGKSTLGRLLSGINGPRTGTVTVGGVELVDLPLETLRTEVALVTQEHHVFKGSVRDNIILAREDSGGRRGVGRPARRGCRGVGRALPDRPGHPARLGQPAAHPCPGPAGRPGAPDHRRPAHAGPRRGHLADRPPHRPHPRGLDERPARGPHRGRHRPPPPHRPRRGPDRRGHRRPDRRAGLAPRAREPARRRVRRTVAGLDVLAESAHLQAPTTSSRLICSAKTRRVGESAGRKRRARTADAPTRALTDLQTRRLGSSLPCRRADSAS